MTSACARVKGINMAQGVCDTACRCGDPGRAARDGPGIEQLTRFDGLPELRQAIAKKLAGYNASRPTRRRRSP